MGQWATPSSKRLGSGIQTTAAGEEDAVIGCLCLRLLPGSQVWIIRIYSTTWATLYSLNHGV